MRKKNILFICLFLEKLVTLHFQLRISNILTISIYEDKY